MQTATAAFATAVTNSDQLCAYKVTLGLPAAIQASYADVTDRVISIQIDSEVTSNLPDVTTLLAGYPSASATLVLMGMLNGSTNDTQTIYWLMNPNDPTSPMYRYTRAGMPVTVQAGLYDGQAAPELITIFTGSIDSCSCADGLVTLVCRDNRSTVTSQAVLPPVITEDPFNAGLTSEFAIDYLLRHSSPAMYYSWPAQRPNCYFAAGYRSSIWPEIGSYTAFSQHPVFGEGLYGTALTSTVGDTSLVYNLEFAILPANTSWFMECFASNGVNFWVDTNTGVGDPLQQVIVHFNSSTNAHIYTQTASGQAAGSNFTVPAGIRYFGVQFSWVAGSTTVSGTAYWPGGSSTFSFTADDARSTTANMVFANVGVDSTVAGSSFEGAQVSLESAGVPNNSFAPTLILDPGGSLNPLVALPDITGQDVWGTLQDIATAEAAVIGFDETGIANFTNRNTIQNTPSVRTVTSTKSLVTLDSIEQMSLVTTHIQIPVNQIAIQPYGTVWSAATTIIVDAGATYSAILTLDNPAVAVGTSIELVPSGGVLATGFSGYRAAVDTNGNGGAVTNLTMTVTQLSPSAVQLTIYNPNSFAIAMVSPAGAGYPTASNGFPCVMIGGQAVTSAGIITDTTNTAAGTTYADAQWPDVADGGAVSNTQFGEILLQLPANAWMQDLPTGQILALDLLSDLYQPRPVFNGVAIVFDPRLQLLDRITLTDDDMSQANNDALVVGNHITLFGAGSASTSQVSAATQSGSWSQSLDTRSFYNPGGWILGLVGHSELGSTTYLMEP